MDENNLKNRLKRYGSVSTAVGGIAARYVGERYLGLAPQEEAIKAQDLRTILGNLKGPIMKVAQFLSTVPNALPPEYAETFRELQSQAPSMGWPFVKRRMSKELGLDWQNLFSEFSQKASAAASLGQVHYAKDLEGNELACKLQYPDMQAMIEADLNQLNIVLGLYEKWAKAIKTIDIKQEIKNRLLEELDYEHELKSIILYQEIFKNHKQFVIPTPFPHLSTKRLLTMQWCPGDSLEQIIQKSGTEQKNVIGRNLFIGWYYPFYHYGVIHGDPHPGNYNFSGGDSINLLDFGCVRIFEPDFVYAVICLYKGLLHNNKEMLVAAYKQWGFHNLTNELIDIITQWASLLYEPLLQDRVRTIQGEDAGIKGWETATRVHEALKKAGGIRPPKEFVFMDRAAVGIGSVILKLKAEQNWHQLFEELIDGITQERIKENQKRVNSNPS